MNPRELAALLDYHYWSRDRLLDAVDALTAEQWIQNLGGSFSCVRDTLAHIYSAEWIWYSRWTGVSPTAMLPADTFPDVTTLRDAWKLHELQVRVFLEDLGEDGIHRVLQYKTTGGLSGASELGQMLQHVVNHASYHRGQVTNMLRQLGAVPPKSMDLITYYREKGA